MSIWRLVASRPEPFEISAEGQEALRDRLRSWANGSWLVERLDLANVEGYEPSPDERAALINATNDVARSSASDAIRDEVRQLREYLIQQQHHDDHRVRQ